MSHNRHSLINHPEVQEGTDSSEALKAPSLRKALDCQLSEPWPTPPQLLDFTEGLFLCRLLLPGALLTFSVF